MIYYFGVNSNSLETLEVCERWNSPEKNSIGNFYSNKSSYILQLCQAGNELCY